MNASITGRDRAGSSRTSCSSQMLLSPTLRPASIMHTSVSADIASCGQDTPRPQLRHAHADTAGRRARSAGPCGSTTTSPAGAAGGPSRTPWYRPLALRHKSLVHQLAQQISRRTRACQWHTQPLHLVLRQLAQPGQTHQHMRHIRNQRPIRRTRRTPSCARRSSIAHVCASRRACVFSA